MTPITDRAAYRQDTIGFVVPVETARELEEIAEELATETEAWIQSSSTFAKVRAIGRVKVALTRYQAMKEKAK